MNATNLILIIDACCELVERPDLQPLHGATFCNVAVSIVAQRVGYKGFVGLMANQMVDLMETSQDFYQVSMPEAQVIANDGSLVIAGQKADVHGHVAIIRPGISKISTKWGGMVPSVANVGGTNFIGKGLNWAFAEPPKIYVWKNK